MKQHKAQSGKNAGHWVNCTANNQCRLGGMHVNKETLKRVQAWKNDGAAKRTNLNDISEEDIKSYSNLPVEMRQGYANDLKSETKAEKERARQEKENAHIAKMAKLVTANNESQKRAERAKIIKDAPPTHRKLSYFNALSGESTYLSFPIVNYTREEKSGLAEFYFAVRSASIYPDSDSRSVELEETINQNKHIISKYHSSEDIEYVKSELKNAASKNEQAYHLREAFIEYTDDINKNVQLGSSKLLNELTRQSKEAEKTYQLREAKKQREEERQKILRKVKDTFKDGENIKLPNIKVTEKMNTNEGYVTPIENIAKRLTSFFGRKK